VPNAIKIELVVEGVSQIEHAFRSVEQASVRTEQRVKRSYDNDAQAARKAAREKEREQQRVAREEVRIREAGYRSNAKISADEVRAAKKTADEKVKADEQWAHQRMRIQLRSAEMAFKLAEDEVRAIEQAERKKHQARERYARTIGGAASRSLGGLASGAVSLAGGALALGGGFGISDIIQKRFAAERQAALIVNAVTTGGKAPSGANVGNILSQAGAVGIGSNMSKEEVTRGVLAYTQSAKGGDFSGAMGQMGFMAKMAKVTGADIGSIGEGMGTLQSQNAALGSTPEGQKALQAMMLAAYAQTKSGHVSLKDAIGQAGTLGSTRGFYAGDTAVNQTQLLGLGQLAAMSGGKEEMGTYAKNIALQSVKHKNRATLQSYGVHYNASGEIESSTAGRTAIEDLIGKTLTGTHGNMGKIADIFGPRGLPVFETLKDSYKSAGGGAKGADAAIKAMREVTGASMSLGDLDAQHAQSMSSPGERFGKVMEQLTQKAEERLVPMIEHLADTFDQWEPKVEKLVDDFADLLEWLASHPWEGLGLIIAGAVTKDIAGAAIGAAIKNAIANSISGGPVGGSGGGAGGGGFLTGAATAGGWMAALIGGAHLGQAASDAYDTHASGRNMAATAHTYLDKWQGGNAGWIGGAKWNPLVSLASMATGAASDAGKIELGEKYTAGGKGVGDLEAANRQRHTDAIDKNTAAVNKLVQALGTSNTNAAPNRNHPLSAPQRGGTT
jgi:hypothetical protein